MEWGGQMRGERQRQWCGQRPAQAASGAGMAGPRLLRARQELAGRMTAARLHQQPAHVQGLGVAQGLGFHNRA